MDLLVYVTTAYHLQLSNHTLEVLAMAPSSDFGDKILPYKPNTPIGALDTQHVRVKQKDRTVPASKVTSLGHQPFENTFRLKVHLPRNQLYVTRVSQNVRLENIMSKVCSEKDLDSAKYELRHPGIPVLQFIVLLLLLYYLLCCITGVCSRNRLPKPTWIQCPRLVQNLSRALRVGILFYVNTRKW